MKYSKSLVLSLLIVAAMPGIAQQTPNLVGKWKVDLDKSIQAMNSQQRTKYDNLPTRSKDNIQRTFSNKTFEFHNDQRVTVVSVINGVSRQVNGQWSYENAPRKLTLTIDGVVHEYRVNPQSTTMVELVHLQQNEKSVFKQLLLTRIN